MVPTVQLDLVLHRNVKAEDRRAGLQREHHRALFCDVPRAARSINRKCSVAALADVARHLRQRTEAAAGAGSARRTIAKALNTLRDRLAVTIHAGHDDNAAVAPVIGCGEDPAMPEGKNRAISGFINLVEVTIAFGFPADGPADDPDDPKADPADQVCLEAARCRACASRLDA